MPRITKIYTRGGDDGTTSLGSGKRFAKDALRIEAYGTVDELNACLGLALASGVDDDIAAALKRIQNELFHLGSVLCFPEEDRGEIRIPQIEKRHVDWLEELLDRQTAEVGPLENFILPGGTIGAANLHLARTVCRRGERILVALDREESVDPWALKYLNRLSDALFVMARYENRQKGVGDVLWDSRA